MVVTTKNSLCTVLCCFYSIAAVSNAKLCSLTIVYLVMLL